VIGEIEDFIVEGNSEVLMRKSVGTLSGLRPVGEGGGSNA